MIGNNANHGPEKSGFQLSLGIHCTTSLDMPCRWDVPLFNFITT